MRILHIGDLHLGKKLGSESRLTEQVAVIKEIAAIADKKDVDVILIAGDIFDTLIPSAVTERVFYRSMIKLAGSGRVVIAIAGNHDDDKRMSAAYSLAQMYGIYLIGNPPIITANDRLREFEKENGSIEDLGETDGFIKDQKTDIDGEEEIENVEGLFDKRVKVQIVNGGVKLQKNDEVVNVALLPYPSESRLSEWAAKRGRTVDYSKSYAERVEEEIDNDCAFFNNDEYNVLCAHLFLSKSGEGDRLGGLMVMPLSILPENADYVALGHVHKYLPFNGKPYVAYSGSPLQYAYDEAMRKYVLMFDTATKKIYDPILLNEGKKLVEISAYDYADCMNKLDEHPNEYVRILYEGSGSGISQRDIAEIMEHPSCNDFVIATKRESQKSDIHRTHLSDEEIFVQYYKKERGDDPSQELISAFLELIGECDDAAD